MSAVLAPVCVSADFHIREAFGGWILSYPEGFFKDDCGEFTTYYAERIFTDEAELGKFITEHMIAFKLWRSKNIVNVNAGANWVDYMNPKDEPLPKPSKRGGR